MNRKYIPLTAAFAIWSGAANADAFTDAIVANLQDLGYEYIEIEDSSTLVKVEAIRGGDKLEVVYDRMTGAIVEEEREEADPEDQGKSGVEITQVEDGSIDVDADDDEDDDDADDADDEDDDDDDADDDDDEDEEEEDDDDEADESDDDADDEDDDDNDDDD